jgi:hypothetical protein
MAGTPLGDSSPASIPLSGVPRRTLHLVQPATRTRRNHGVFMIGDELASVYSTRRESSCLGVTMVVGNGALQLSGSMTPVQARAMARALSSAADAVEQLQRGEA